MRIIETVTIMESYYKIHASGFENKLVIFSSSFIFHNVFTLLDQHLHTSRRLLYQHK